MEDTNNINEYIQVNDICISKINKYIEINDRCISILKALQEKKWIWKRCITLFSRYSKYLFSPDLNSAKLGLVRFFFKPQYANIFNALFKLRFE